MKLTMTITCALAVAAAITAPASAAVLYDNGPTNTALNSRPINFGNTTADSFTLASDSTIDGVTFESLDFPDTVFTNVNWAISSTLDFGATTAAAAVSSAYLFTQGNGYHVDTNSFATGNLNLAAGTYYLLLNNAVTSTNSSAYWAESGGPSQAFQNGFPYETSEAFQINGTPNAAGAVPEPATWGLLIIGFGAIGVSMRQKHSADRLTRLICEA